MANIYISDMDGTLLDNDGYLSDYTRKKLEELIARGVQFTVASARDYHAIIAALKGLRLQLPVIECNGSYLSEPATGKKLGVTTIENIDFLRICDAFEKHQLPMMIRLYDDEIEKICFSKRFINKAYQSYWNFRKSTKDTQLIELEDMRVLKDKKKTMINTIGPKKELFALIEDIKKEDVQDIEVHAMSTAQKDLYFFNLSNRRANKGDAIRELKNRFFNEEDTIICFGDNINDLALFEQADQAIAVANAQEYLKEQADLIIGRNDEDAVVRYIERKENESTR